MIFCNCCAQTGEHTNLSSTGCIHSLQNPQSAKYLEQGISNKTLRSFLELPKKTGDVLQVKPGVTGAAALKELINLRNQEQK